MVWAVLRPHQKSPSFGIGLICVNLCYTDRRSRSFGGGFFAQTKTGCDRLMPITPGFETLLAQNRVLGADLAPPIVTVLSQSAIGVLEFRQLRTGEGKYY